jgi:hypothetical protein
MAQIRYTNDLGNGHSGYVNGPIPVAIESGSLALSGEVQINPAGTTAADAFGRLRVSDPYTLFDSSHRYQDNGLWATSTATGEATFDANEGLVNLTISGDGAAQFVKRETYKVFSYQPGKSLLVMNSFVMDTKNSSLTQTVGYFNDENGIFLKVSGSNTYIVKRNYTTGSAVDTEVAQTSWNKDVFDGSGSEDNPSGLSLDLTKSQLLWMDFEWLGVGSVRVGFVINGIFYVAHTFNYANLTDSTSAYITTACLPCRYEISGSADMSGTKTLKQICSTVLSEGGYSLDGRKDSVSVPLSTPTDLPVANTFEPVIALRLKSTRLDGISIIKGLSTLGLTSNSNYQWFLSKGATISGGTWLDVNSNSNLEYNITATGLSGQERLLGGFFSSSNQSSTGAQLAEGSLLRYQFERDSFTNTPVTYVLEVASDNAGADVYALLDVEDITY